MRGFSFWAITPQPRLYEPQVGVGPAARRAAADRTIAATTLNYNVIMTNARPDDSVGSRSSRPSSLWIVGLIVLLLGAAILGAVSLFGGEEERGPDAVDSGAGTPSIPAE